MPTTRDGGDAKIVPGHGVEEPNAGVCVNDNDSEGEIGERSDESVKQQIFSRHGLTHDSLAGATVHQHREPPVAGQQDDFSLPTLCICRGLSDQRKAIR